MSKLTENLKSMRLERKLSQTAVAEAVGITKQSYCNYENGKRNPDFDTLIKLAEFFGTDTEYLLQGDNSLPIPDSRLKFALFGDSEIDDDVLDDVKRLAILHLELRRQKGEDKKGE